MFFLFWIRKYNIKLCRELEMYCLHLGNNYTSLGALFLPLSSHPEVILYIAKLGKFPPSFCIWFCIWAWKTYSNKTFPPTKNVCSSWIYMLSRCDIPAYHASSLQRSGGWAGVVVGAELWGERFVWGVFFPWLCEGAFLKHLHRLSVPLHTKPVEDSNLFSPLFWFF